MASPIQELTVTYSGYAVGGSSGRILEAYHTFELGTITTAVEYSFIIPQVANAAAMAVAVAAAELAFNTPYAALTVVQSASTLLSLSHSASTGFNSHPRIIKTESLADSGNSRRYVVRIDFGMPATNFGTNYRQSSQVRVTYDPSRRRHLQITAVYTANGGTGSRAQALAAGPTYAGTVVTALTGTWEKTGESVENDDQDKIATWVRTYDELIFSDAGSTDDTALNGGKLTVDRVKSAPGDFGTTTRLVVLNLTYSAAVDWSVTTALSAKFDAIRAWIVTQIQTTLGTGTMAVTSETFTPDYPNNGISVKMTVEATSGSNIAEWSFETEDFVSEGGVLVSTWTGNKFDKFLFQGSADYVRTETATQVYIGKAALQAVMDTNATGLGSGAKDAVVVGQEPGPRGLDNFIRVSKRPKVSHETHGLPGNQFDVTKVTSVTITTWFTKPASGGGNVQTGPAGFYDRAHTGPVVQG